MDAEASAVTNLIHGLFGISKPTTPIHSATLEAPSTGPSGESGQCGF